MSADDFPPGRWHARWIWCTTPRIGVVAPGTPVLADDAAPVFACFRRSFEVARVPERAPARITSDSRHVLWLNGVELARGPIRGDPRRLHYDVVDLATHLVGGRNVIAVLVRFYRNATPWWIPVRPTFALGAGSLAFEARVGDEWIGSDASWRVLASDAWQSLSGHGIGGAPIEMHDARRLPESWKALDFDDGGWSPAVELGAAYVGTSGDPRPPCHPFGPLLPRPIPQLGGVLREAKAATLRRTAGAGALDDPVDQVEADDRAAEISPAAHRSGAARSGSSSVGSPAASSAASSSLESPVAALPLRIDAGRGVALLTIDLEEQTSGTVQLEVDAPAGTRFDVSVAEGLTSDGALDRLDQHSGFRYVARGRDDRFESFEPMGFRFARIAVRAAAGPVTLRRLAVQERLLPRPAGTGFWCSDPLLERIWAIGRRTVDLCSHDAYLDCPSREQRAWTGDSVVHQMVDLATNPDWSLARRHVELTASPRPDGMLPMAIAGDFEAADATFIPDWPLHWVRALHNLYRYSGDRDFVARLLAPAESLLRWFEPFQGSSGLLADVTGWVLIDWSAVTVAGACAALNALWARALLDFAEIAVWLGDGARAAWARSRWERVRAGFDAFWDPARGVYVDSLLDGTQQRPVSQHANAAAICARLVPAERIAGVIETTIDPARLVRASWLLPGRTTPPEDGNMYGGAATLVTGPPPPWWDVEHKIVAAQPFFRYVVHDAVALAGQAERIPALCRDWEELIERSPKSWSETWFGGTRCHAWCATPTRDLIVRTLGVTPAEPGFAVARIAPALGDLAWARGAVPTPRGPLDVAVEGARVRVDSPVPIELHGRTGEVIRRHAGKHDLTLAPG